MVDPLAALTTAPLLAETLPALPFVAAPHTASAIEAVEAHRRIQ